MPVSIVHDLRHFHSALDIHGRQDPKGNSIVQEYILPDFSTNRQGRIRQPDDIIAEMDQILLMNNERFSVPEILFRPDDIGRFSFICIGVLSLFSALRF